MYISFLSLNLPIAYLFFIIVLIKLYHFLPMPLKISNPDFIRIQIEKIQLLFYGFNIVLNINLIFFLFVYN